MKKKKNNFLKCLSLFCLGSYLIPSFTYAFLVSIDAGHGGNDHGATYNGVKESEITWQISQKLKSLLEKDPQIHVLLTRPEKQLVPLAERTIISNSQKSDLFLSIHANASPRGKARGAEFYFQNQLPPSEEALYLAMHENENTASQKEEGWPLNKTPLNIQGTHPEVLEILKDLQKNYRIRLSSLFSRSLYSTWEGTQKNKAYSIKQAPFYLLENIKAPSNLVEIGFVSNENEARRLASENYQWKIAHSLYNGIKKFKDFMDKSPHSILH